MRSIDRERRRAPALGWELERGYERSLAHARPQEDQFDRPLDLMGAIDFPGNPHLRPPTARKMVLMTQEMEQREELLSNNAVIVTETGALGLNSKEELKDVIFHHFEIRKHEFHVFPSYPEPFLVLFSEQRDRDVVFARGRVIEGPYEFRFHLWNADLHGDRLYIPYHIKLSLEGLPQHAWFHDIASKVLCDEAVIHHVHIDTLRRTDQRAYVC